MGSVELQWEQATFMPVGVSDLKNYHIYSSLLLPGEEKVSDAVFLKPSKIMNSVCGLENNAVKYGVPLTDSHCRNGRCSATVSGVLPKKRYMFNTVAESMRDFNSTYSGIIVTSDWGTQRSSLENRRHGCTLSRSSVWSNRRCSSHGISLDRQVVQLSGYSVVYRRGFE